MKPVVIRREAVEARLGDGRSLSNTVTSLATHGQVEERSPSGCERTRQVGRERPHQVARVGLLAEPADVIARRQKRTVLAIEGALR
jgi:hypothetical protein